MSPQPCALLLAAVLVGAPFAGARAQQPLALSGRITNQDGNPVATATVAIPAFGLGTTIRSDGSYTLPLPDRLKGQTVGVSVRAIGYKPVVVQVAIGETGATQDFALESNPLQLGELVVTGAGTETEVEKLGSVRNNVDSALIARSNEASVVNAISAKAPNVEVISASGDPGASASIRIRGANTLGGDGQPLFVVDGQPIDNSVTTTAALDPQTGGRAGRRLVAQPRDRHQPRRHRVDRDPEGSGGGRGLRRARGAGRHPDHHQEGASGRHQVQPAELVLLDRHQPVPAAPASVRAGRRRRAPIPARRPRRPRRPRFSTAMRPRTAGAPRSRRARRRTITRASCTRPDSAATTR